MEADQRRSAPGLGLVLSSFALNGVLYGSLLSRYAEIADMVQASAVAFGVVLAAGAVGGLLGSIIAPAVVRALREVGAVVLFGCAFALLAIGVAAAPTLGVLAVALFVMTMADGGHDVSMNALAVRVQQRTGQSIMGRSHAAWSLSLTAGTAVGAGAAWLGVPVPVHVGAVVVTALLLQLSAWWFVRVDHRVTNQGSVVAAVDGPPASALTWRAWAGDRRILTLVITLAVAAIAASYVESPGQEWTALLLSRGFDAGPGLAAAGPLVFSAGLLASRLVLDLLTRYLRRSLIALGAAGTIVISMLGGLYVAASGGGELQALLMIALAGVGAGPIFPLLFGAAEVLSDRHQIAPATTTSIVSAVSRTGAITAPAVIGAVTEVTALSTVFLVMAAGGLAVMATLPRALRPARAAATPGAHS